MVILIMQRAPVSLRGELSRWMIEPRAGVFVGKVSAMVRDKLWEKACQAKSTHGAMLLYSSQSEQGFTVLTHGDSSRSVIRLDGLSLIHVPHEAKSPTRKRASKTAAEASPPDDTAATDSTDDTAE